MQTWGGYNTTQIRNLAGNVSRVDYLGGATFATNEQSLWNIVKKIGFSVADNCLATSAEITNGAAVWVHSREGVDGTLKVSTQFFYVENSALATYQSNFAILASVNSYGGINSPAVYLQPELNTVTP